VSRYLLDLDGEPKAVLLLLRMLLKILWRQYGVKCRSIRPADAGET
jgi:hypothetical protein